MNLGDLNNELEAGEYFVVDPDYQLAVVFARHNELEDGPRRVFKIVHGDLEELDYKDIIERLLKMLVDKVDMRDYMKEVLLTTPPGKVIEAFENLEGEEVLEGVSAIPHCFILSIPSKKPGRENIEIALRYS